MPEHPTHANTEEPNETDQRPDTDRDGGSSADVKAPFEPHEDDDSALGDTDQHSTA